MGAGAWWVHARRTVAWPLPHTKLFGQLHLCDSRGRPVEGTVPSWWGSLGELWSA